MKQIKRIGLSIFLLLLLTACGLGTEDIPADGLTGAVGVPKRTPVAQNKDSAYPKMDVFDVRCQGEKIAGQTFALAHFEVENAKSAPSFIDDWKGETAVIWLNVGEGLKDYAGGINCEGAGESMAFVSPDTTIGKLYDLNPNDLAIVDWLLAQKLTKLTVTLDTGQSRTLNDVSSFGLVATKPLDILTNNENITEFTTEIKCEGVVVPESDLAQVSIEMKLPNGTSVVSPGLFAMDASGTELRESFSCSGIGQVTAVTVKAGEQDVSLVQIEVPELMLKGSNGQSVVMSGGTTMFTATTQPVVMSGGSTMLSNYYEGTVATGGLVISEANIADCYAVFEPNDHEARLAVSLTADSDIGPIFMIGGGTMFFDEADALFKESVGASCEGMGEVTAVPIYTDEYGRTQWLASVDLSDAVWKAPAGQEGAGFFSENGHRSLLSMTTGEEVNVPQTAVTQAYDLNPNDYIVAEFSCTSAAVASDPDNGDNVDGEVRKHPGSAIMFETLIDGETTPLRGGGTMLVGKASASPIGNIQASCAQGAKGTVKSAEIALGDGSVRALTFSFPELTLQTADGKSVTYTDVTILGLAPDDLKMDW